MRNIFLMAIVNIGIMLTLSLLLSLTGMDAALYQYGLNYGTLAVFCFVFGMGGAIFSLLLSKTMARWIMGVKIFKRGEGDATALRLQASLQQISAKAGLKKMPELGIYDSPEINAFATGPSQSNSLVALSSGLINQMSYDEVEGVIAHEVAHIRNGDMVTMTLIQGIINALVMFIAHIIAFAVTASMERESNRYWIRWMITSLCQVVLGIFGMMVVAWFSRKREYRADLGGAKFAGPQKMIGALEALQRRFTPVDPRGQQLNSLKISAGEKKRGFLALISTHPPIGDRIAALKKATLR